MYLHPENANYINEGRKLLQCMEKYKTQFSLFSVFVTFVADSGVVGLVFNMAHAILVIKNKRYENHDNCYYPFVHLYS